MTGLHFTCADFADRLADYLERDDAAAPRAAMDAHAAGCGECAAILADIAALRSTAAALPPIAPSRDLWTGIADRIQAPVVALDRERTVRTIVPAARRTPRWLGQMAAAAALVAVSVGVTYVATRQAMGDVAPVTASRAGRTEQQTAIAAGQAGQTVRVDTVYVASASQDAGAAAAPTALVSRGGGSAAPRAPQQQFATASLASVRPPELAGLDSLYDREILRLRQVLGLRRAQLDSTTVQVLDRNLALIDAAIRECRAALARDPASTYLNEQLNQALESKIELLRAAATASIGD